MATPAGDATCRAPCWRPALWLAGSAALRLYGTWILAPTARTARSPARSSALLWVWLTGFAVLLGAELNAQIEHLWPTRDPDGNDSPPSRLRRAGLHRHLTGAVRRPQRTTRRERQPEREPGPCPSSEVTQLAPVRPTICWLSASPSPRPPLGRVVGSPAR